MKTLLTRLEFYWAGVRYITAALTQKAEGVGTAGLDIAEGGPNVTLVTALNSKAKAARLVDPNCEYLFLLSYTLRQLNVPPYRVWVRSYRRVQLSN
jgi:hypothetical protein